MCLSFLLCLAFLTVAPESPARLSCSGSPEEPCPSSLQGLCTSSYTSSVSDTLAPLLAHGTASFYSPFMCQLPYPCPTAWGRGPFFCSHSTVYVPGHSSAMLSYKCLWTHLYLRTHRKLQRGLYEENVTTCTAASAWLPVGTYYYTFLGNKLNPFRAIQFNKLF